TCIIYNKGFFIQLKRLRVFLFSKYFLNPNIYYRATFYTTKKRTIVVVIISSTECSFLYQLFYYTFLLLLNIKKIYNSNLTNYYNNNIKTEISKNDSNNSTN